MYMPKKIGGKWCIVFQYHDGNFDLVANVASEVEAINAARRLNAASAIPEAVR